MISERTGTITRERAAVRARGAAVGSTTVVIADDHAGFRCALESLIRSAEDLELIGSACDGAEAVRLRSTSTPRVHVPNRKPRPDSSLMSDGVATMVTTARDVKSTAARSRCRIREWASTPRCILEIGSYSSL